MSRDWQDFKCRCSAINQMLSESRSNPCLTEIQEVEFKKLEGLFNVIGNSATAKQKERYAELLLKKENSKKVILSDTCIGYLMEHYAWVTQGMVSVTKEMDIDYLNKGKMMEEESIKLLSIVDGVIYEKNKERIYNDFLSGEPDIYLGEGIMKATRISDTKSVWDYPGFLKKIHCPIDKANEQQIQGYMDITGATEGEVAHCLVDMPETIVNDYRRRLMYKMNVATDQNIEYLEAVKMMENSMYFSKIPMQQRVFKKKVQPFSEFERQKVYDKVKVCRDWLFSFDEMYQKLNK